MLICFVPVCVPGIQFFERCAENSERAQWLTPFSVILDSFPAVGFLHMLYFFLFDASAQSVLHDYPPFPRPQTGRPRMINAYGHTTGNTPEPVLISEVKPSQAQLVLRWETTWEHWVLYAFLLPLFRHPPAVHPTSPLQSASSPPSQPAAHMVRKEIMKMLYDVRG